MQLLPRAIRVLVAVDESCSEFTRGHSERTAAYAVQLAEFMGFGSELADQVRLGGLLHDVGKRASRTGAVSRSIGTLFDSMGFPITSRMGAYRRHGSIGADELAGLGCDPLAVAFARHHPGPAPDGVDPTRWSVLLDADG